jgi:hypothetical protein
VRHVVHAWEPGVALKVPIGQSEHTLFHDAPGARTSYSPEPHTLMSWHTRSAESVGALNVYWSVGHFARCVLQPRSSLEVGALCSHSPSVQVVTWLHVAPLSRSEYDTPDTQGAHLRLAVLDPALVLPDPTAHVAQAVHFD